MKSSQTNLTIVEDLQASMANIHSKVANNETIDAHDITQALRTCTHSKTISNIMDALHGIYEKNLLQVDADGWVSIMTEAHIAKARIEGLHL